MTNRFKSQYGGVLPFLLVGMFLCFILSARFGAVSISLNQIATALEKWVRHDQSLSLNENIFLQIRLPRALLCLAVGASLSVAGVLMQALFRNPLVEPGLIGTSSGAAFGAAMYLVLGATFKINAGEWTLPLAACLGGLASTAAVMLLAGTSEAGRTSIVVLLLIGIAINSLFMSGVGFLSYIARDPQARSITFWNLGTLSGAHWKAVWIVGTVCIVCLTVSLRYAKELNALMLGEEEAHYLGTNIPHLKRVIMFINVLLVAVATSFVGVIGFIGLIAPHIMRLFRGSDNRYLLLGSVITGAILLTLADLVSRLLLSPAELPIGIVTSFVGVPLFIFMLKKGKHYF